MPLNQTILNWIDPKTLAKKISQNHQGNFIFLYSGLHEEISNSTSYLAPFCEKELFLDNLDELQSHLNPDKTWFGYVSYEHKNNLEKFSQEKNSIINLAKIYFANYNLIFEFNHNNQTLTVHYKNKNQLEEVLNYQEKFTENKNIFVENLSSNFSSAQYLQAISNIQEKIVNGDLYQTNLTRKFFGNVNLNKDEEFFATFLQLTNSSPANYSSFLKINNNFIISSSPELFFSIKNNKIISRPIKGTAPRESSSKQDEENKIKLQNSPKERAENLMIVDLVRNDLSRFCKAASVKVKNLFQVNSYKTLHHLSSEIIGEVEDKFSTTQIFNSCFPPASMTGTPKIKAIEVAQNLEKINRGIYSGAIGYFKGEKDANFSVVIRTLICQKNNVNTNFEFQVGGAITYDSKPQDELDETFNKAKAIAKVLGIENEIKKI